MEIDLFIEREKKREKVSFSGKTIGELLKLLQVNPEAVITVRNREVVTEQELLKDKDKVELLSVISGG